MIYVYNSVIATELYFDWKIYKNTIFSDFREDANKWILSKFQFLKIPDAPTTNKRICRGNNVSPMTNRVNI